MRRRSRTCEMDLHLFSLDVLLRCGLAKSSRSRYIRMHGGQCASKWRRFGGKYVCVCVCVILAREAGGRRRETLRAATARRSAPSRASAVRVPGCALARSGEQVPPCGAVRPCGEVSVAC